MIQWSCQWIHLETPYFHANSNRELLEGKDLTGFSVVSIVLDSQWESNVLHRAMFHCGLVQIIAYNLKTFISRGHSLNFHKLKHPVVYVLNCTLILNSIVFCSSMKSWRGKQWFGLLPCEWSPDLFQPTTIFSDYYNNSFDKALIFLKTNWLISAQSFY